MTSEDKIIQFEDHIQYEPLEYEYFKFKKRKEFMMKSERPKCQAPLLEFQKKLDNIS